MLKRLYFFGFPLRDFGFSFLEIIRAMMYNHAAKSESATVAADSGIFLLERNVLSIRGDKISSESIHLLSRRQCENFPFVFQNPLSTTMIRLGC